jgi:hypothetical protein
MRLNKPSASLFDINSYLGHKRGTDSRSSLGTEKRINSSLRSPRVCAQGWQLIDAADARALGNRFIRKSVPEDAVCIRGGAGWPGGHNAIPAKRNAREV